MRILQKIYLLSSFLIIVFLTEKLFKCYTDLKFKITMAVIPSKDNDVAEILYQVLKEHLICIYILFSYVIIGIIIQIYVLIKSRKRDII